MLRAAHGNRPSLPKGESPLLTEPPSSLKPKLLQTGQPCGPPVISDQILFGFGGSGFLETDTDAFGSRNIAAE